MFIDWEWRNKTAFVHSWHDLYVEYPNESIKELELISDYSKVSQNKITFLYVSYEQVEFKVHFKIFIFSNLKMKYLVINVTKYVQNLHK